MRKVYKDFIPPASGRVYSITAVGDGTSRIEDVTQYIQEGDTWGAGDANNKSDISIRTSVTLEPGSWQGEAAPYTITVPVEGVTADSNQEIMLSLDASPDQVKAYQGANLQDGGQSTGSIILKAFGQKPAIAIPVRILLRGD